jgi:hypothetical protein
MRGCEPGERRGGRAAGVKNARTKELEQRAALSRAIAEKRLGKKAFNGDAHAFLCMIYKDEEQPLDIRLDAAKAAIPYEKPRLAAIAARIENAVTYESLIMKAVESVASKEIEYDK